MKAAPLDLACAESPKRTAAPFRKSSFGATRIGSRRRVLCITVTAHYYFAFMPHNPWLSQSISKATCKVDNYQNKFYSGYLENESRAHAMSKPEPPLTN